MTSRRLGVAIVAVFALALALRVLPLAWSPYPATLDGIGYAALARDTLAAGQFPVAEMRADNFVFTGFLATTGAVLGLAPLRVAQPSIAFVGAAAVVAVVAIARRFAADLGATPTATRLVVVLVGLGLAVDGLYLRRTGVPDEEILAFVLLPVLVLSLYRGLRTERPAWFVPAAVLLVAFPLLHTFSTFVAGTTLVALLAAARDRLPPARLAAGTAIVAGFWGYFGGYYTLTPRFGLVVPYVDRVTAFPGLFAAWLVAMVVGIWWLERSGAATQRAVLLVPFAVGFAAVFVNIVTPVFPGTAQSPGRLAVPIALYLLPVGLAIAAVPTLAANREGGPLFTALLAAPVTITGFSLTAALTPEYFGTVMRVQTFAHPTVVALAALAVVGLGVAWRDRVPAALTPALAALLLVSLLLTTPIAYVDLDTLAFPSTTTESEFQAASFVAQRSTGAFASDHVLTRITIHYYDRSGAMGPTAGWFDGGPPPACALLSAESWTTTGAHFFPAGPRTVTASRYQRTLAERHVVYSAGGGYDAFALSLPVAAADGC